MTTLLLPPAPVGDAALPPAPAPSWLRRHRLILAIVAGVALAGGLALGLILGLRDGGSTTTVTPQGTVSDFVRGESDFMNRLSPQDALFAQRAMETQYANGPSAGGQPGSAAWAELRQSEVAWMNAG
jgi:hypothetical protein